MTNTIRIRRRTSGATGAPSGLKNAELAFNEVDETLYYGKGDSGGDATSILAIGGPGAFVNLSGSQTISGTKTFTGTISLGSLATATTQSPLNNSTAVATTAYVDAASAEERIQDIVGAMVSTNNESGISVTYDDSNGKLDFDISDPTITIAGDVDGSATMTNLGNTTINVTLDTVNSNTGTFGSATAIPVVTVNGKGLITAVTTSSISTTLTVGADTGTADGVSLATDTLTFSGGEGIDTAVTNNTITISGEDATTSNKGIASFSSDSFSVASGAVSIKSGGVSNSQLANSSITLGTTTVSLGATSLSLGGVQQLDVDNIRIDGNTISATDTNGGISIDPNGTGHVSVNNARIENLAEPVAATDAATKGYVDSVAEGLHVHASVKAATGDTLANITGGSVTYANGTGGSGATLTLGTALTALDGYSLQNTDRILVKNQANAAHNGIYTWATGGTVLTRATDFDSGAEIAGGDFVFVDNGTNYGNTGWVCSDEVTTVGTDNVNWIQFSGAGTYLAGNGLALNGSTFDIVLATNSGLVITSDELQVNSTIAGNGLSFASGVLTVGGTADRITVGSDTVDIAATYVGQSSITTLGTIATGTWQGTIVSPTYGGTGVNNGSKTITLGGNLETSGAYNTTLTTTANTNVTLPTTGTLATLAGTENLTNKTINASSIGATTPGTGAFTTLSSSGATTFTANTASSSYTTGTLVVTGGVGISGALYGNSSVLSGFTIDGGTF